MNGINFQKKVFFQEEITQLFDLWSSFGKSEIDRFRQLLRSPYFNEDEAVPLLFEHILISKEKGSQSIQGSKLSGKVFEDHLPLKKWETEMRGKLRQLLALTGDFIRQQGLEQHPAMAYEAQLAGMRKYDQNEHFRDVLTRYQAILEAMPFSVESLTARWWLHDQRYYRQTSKKYTDDLDHFYEAIQLSDLLEKLFKVRYACEMRNKVNLRQEKEDYLRRPDVKQALERPASEPVIFLYQLAYRLLSQRDNIRHHLTFVEAFEAHEHELTASDKLALIKYGLNAANFVYERAKSETRWLRYWTDKNANKQVVLFENVISPGEYLNIALSYAAAGELEKQRSFSETHRNKLPKEDRDMCFWLSMAYYHFFSDKLDEALAILTSDLFAHPTATKPFYHLRVKSLVLRIYLLFTIRNKVNFDPAEIFDRAWDTLRKYLYRNGYLSESTKESYRHFLSMQYSLYKSALLVQVNPGSKAAEKERLLTKLRAYKHVATGPWMENIIDMYW